METIQLAITKFNAEILSLALILLAVLCAIFIIYWFYNRKKFHQLAHQIPAGVLKNYLDTIIENSVSLRSSLLRGGGADGAGIPAVMPLDQLRSSMIAEAPSANSEEWRQFQSELASLRERLSDKDKVIFELEKKISLAPLSTSSGEAGDNSAYIKQIHELEQEIERLLQEIERLQSSQSASPAGSEGATNEEMAKKLEKVVRERDDLKERLLEYEIIEEDLANLKRLQIENEELKKKLAELGQSTDITSTATSPIVAAAESGPSLEQVEAELETPTPEATPPEQAAEAASEEVAAPTETSPEAPATEEVSTPSTDSVESKAEETSSSEEVEAKAEEEAPEAQKSTEELLSEFEKMLG